MFSQLTNFGYKRTKKEALGFYFAYLFLMMLIGGLLAFILVPSDVQTEAEAFEAGAKVGARFAPIAAITLAVLVLNAKKSLSEFKNIFLVLLSGILAILGGGLLGLIPVAYLTTTGEESIITKSANKIANTIKKTTSNKGIVRKKSK